MKKIRLLLLTVATLICFGVSGATGEPIITFHSDAYAQVGDGNKFSFLIGVTQPGKYTVSDAYGEREVELTQAIIENGDWSGTWISFHVDADTKDIKVWGDPLNVNTIVADGAYLTSVDMEACTNLDVLSLEHNALQKLDLTPFTKLMAIYVTDNPFTVENPLKIGTPKPNLQILEIDIVKHLDQSFNLSDYPAMRAFDAYSNEDLWSLDPTGCPELLVLSCELTNVSSLDVSQNTKLLRLNVSESRIESLDISNNKSLEHFLGGHYSGSVNVGYKLKNIDFSQNTELTILNMYGNDLESIDLSNNTKLTNLTLSRNKLTSLNTENNPNLVSLYVMDNDMDFATLPNPDGLMEYFYRQNPIKVNRAIGKDQILDLSSKVLRPGTSTIARVWKKTYGADPELIDESLYSYSNGKISFNTVMADSVYVEYANSLLDQYPLTTTAFKVKNVEDLAKPSPVISIWPQNNGQINFTVGMYGATPETPKQFMVDFGDGNLVSYTSTSALENLSANVTGTSSGTVIIYAPEGEVITSFYLNGVPLSAADITAATELCKLQIANCGLAELNLKYNRCLQWLDISGNKLTTLDLTGVYGDYEKNVLSTLNASNNEIASFTNMAPLAMLNLNLANNKLSEIVLKDYDRLQTLNLSNNLLAGDFDMTYLYAATDVNVSNNNFETITPCAENIPANLNISNNKYGFATLPNPAIYGSGFIYAPQKQIEIPSRSCTVDLRSEYVTVDGNPTEFVWKYRNGSPVASGYEVVEGFTTFTDPTIGRIYCELNNASFPQFTGANALRTTVTLVIERPTFVAASFTPTEVVGLPQVIMAAPEAMELYIEWNENGIYVPVVVQDHATYFTTDNVVTGKSVKIYADDQEQASKLNVFSVYGMNMSSIDASKLTGLYCFGAGDGNLTPDKIVMPEAEGLKELILAGNNFTSFPYADKYKKLTYLILANNKFTTFDASSMPQLQNLSLSGNKLKSVSFNNPALWNLMLDNNNLSEINLNGLPALQQLVLNANNLSSIDLSPVANILHVLSIVDNQFTFATLPVQSDYPNLDVYYYGIQAPIIATCNDMKVDLSSQAMIAGMPTTFVWYRDMPVYNEDTGEIEGNLLEEGTDYTIENGVTTFLKWKNRDVICLMYNDLFPNLLQMTNLLKVQGSGVENIGMEDADANVTVYNLQGVKVASGSADVINNLPKGIYIINGKKIVK